MMSLRERTMGRDYSKVGPRPAVVWSYRDGRPRALPQKGHLTAGPLQRTIVFPHFLVDSFEVKTALPSEITMNPLCS